MILALDTGWTDRSIERLGERFRAACHWAVYVRAIAGPEGLPQVSIPKGGSLEQRLAAGKAIAELARLRADLYPEDADG